MSYPHFNHSRLYCCLLGIVYNGAMGCHFVLLRLLLGLLSFDVSFHHCCALAFAPIAAPPRKIHSSLTSPEIFTAGPRCSSLFQPQGKGQWRSKLADGWGAGITRWTGTTTTSRGRGGLCMAQESLILTEENVIAVLTEAKQELSTLFGNSKENAAVGITGDVEFVGLEGPTAVVRLTGRFWHEKTTVLSRVANFVMTRIPECVDVEVEDPAQLEDADPPEANVKAPEI